MQPITEAIKRYWPLLLGLVGLILVFRKFSQSSGGTSQVVNRIIPIDNQTDRNELLRTQLEFKLGEKKLENEARLADKAIDAEGQRLRFQNEALVLSGQLAKSQQESNNAYALAALEIERNKATAANELQRNLAEIARDSNLFDTQTRANAALELQRQARNSSLLNQLTGIGAGLLNRFLPQGQQQGQSRGGSPGGGASGGGQSGSSGGLSPQQSAELRRRQEAQRRNSALALIGNWLTNSYSNPNYISSIDYDSLGYASGYDLSQFYQNEINAFDNLPFGWDDYEPFGSVTSSFQYGDVLGWDNSYSNFNWDNNAPVSSDYFDMWDYYSYFDE